MVQSSNDSTAEDFDSSILDAQFARCSGRGLDLPVPLARRGWNWGAFVFGGVWLIAHGDLRRGLLLLVLDLVPPVGLLGHLWCGRQGDRLAFNGCRYESAADFVARQRLWRNGAPIAVSLALATVVGTSHAIDGGAARQPANLVSRAENAASGPPEISTNGPRASHANGGSVPAAAPVSLHRPLAKSGRLDRARRTTAWAPPTTPSVAACGRASENLNAAILSTDARGRLARSQSAIDAAGRCSVPVVRHEIEALALSQKAIAEHDAHLPGWNADITTSYHLSNACAQQAADTDSLYAARCLQIANRAATMAADWTQRS